MTLLRADNTTGFFGVVLSHPGYPKPYQARVTRGGKDVSLGSFATAEEAALCVARSPEGQAAAQRAAAVLTSEEAQQQAQAEGLTLVKSDNKTGYFCVSLNSSCKLKLFQAQVWRGGKKVQLGCFVTAEEAALYIARLRAPPLVSEDTAGRAAAQPHVASDDGGGDDAGEEVEEEFEVLDAVEVLDAWTDDDGDDTASVVNSGLPSLPLPRRNLLCRAASSARAARHGAGDAGCEPRLVREHEASTPRRARRHAGSPRLANQPEAAVAPG